MAPQRRINFQTALKKVVASKIGPLGYRKISMPKWKGAGITFFRKHLLDDTYGYIQFQLGRWAATPPDVPPMPRSFKIILLRNQGTEPDPIPREYPYYLTMSLSSLLWVVLGIYKYEWQYHEWKYFTADELEIQLQLATDDLVQYGIPWLEDLKSKNPLLNKHSHNL
jgi:hypothetical protein